MNLVLNTGEKLPFDLYQNEPAVASRSQLKHLQHVTIPFRDWDLPYQLWQTDLSITTKKFFELGTAVGIKVDTNRCNEQLYLNQLHEVYERNYDGNPAWLSFHEHLHLLEKRNRTNHLRIDYRELAGLVEKPFKYDWVKTGNLKISKGTIYTQWSELGKTPFDYWTSNEPNDLSRMTELSKPWIKYKAVFKIALEDIDLSVVYADQQEEFKLWWAGCHHSWCQHWNIPEWTLEQMHSGIPIGFMESVDWLFELLVKGSKPYRLSLT